MLGLAKRIRVKILQASTSEVYGDPDVHPQTEDYWGKVNPIGPKEHVTTKEKMRRSFIYELLPSEQRSHKNYPHL